MTDTDVIVWSCGICQQGYTYEPASTETDTYGAVCEDCAADVVSCENCWCSIHGDDVAVTSCDGVVLCDSCMDRRAYVCDNCNGTAMPSHVVRDPFGATLCESCYDGYYSCDNCGGFFHSESYDSVLTDYGYYCCSGCAPQDSCGVQSYSYKPHFQIFGRFADGLSKATTYGVELEVEYRNCHDTQEAHSLLTSMWSNTEVTFLKSDGSLSNGVEAVSHPMTLRYAKEHINRQALRDLSCLGIRSWNTNTCGLHVHIGRDTFVNYSHLARFLILLHRSKPSIVALAGRDCSRWASFDLGQDESIVLQAQGKQYPQTRYRAVNLTNDDTVEVRVFRGTLNPDTIIAHLELLDAMIEYTRRQRKIVGLSMSLTWLWFRGWLADNNETYPAANERCAARVDNRRI